MKYNRQRIIPSWAKNMVLGLAVSWSISLGICMICAGLIAKGAITQSATGYCALAALLLGSFGGAMIPKRGSEGKRNLWCILQGAAFLSSLLLAGTILYQEPLAGFGVTALVTLGGAGVSVLWGNRQKRLVSRKRRSFKPKALV